MICFIDTDHISHIQNGTAEGAAIQRRLRSIAPDDFATTVITYEEQCRGWLDKINRARTSETCVFAYTQLRANLSFFSNIAVVEYTSTADAKYEALVQPKVRIGTNDLKIAAIALANGATVLTRNTRDFSRVPGLLYADWTV